MGLEQSSDEALLRHYMHNALTTVLKSVQPFLHPEGDQDVLPPPLPDDVSGLQPQTELRILDSALSFESGSFAYTWFQLIGPPNFSKLRRIINVRTGPYGTKESVSSLNYGKLKRMKRV